MAAADKASAVSKARKAWLTEASDEYSPGQFHVRATNAYDHSNSHRLHLPRELDGMAQEIVAMVPAYRSVSDLIRDAIYHRVHYLSGRGLNNPLVLRWLELEKGQAAIERAKTEVEMHKSIVEEARVTIEQLTEAGDWGQLELMLDSLEPTLEAMRDPWHTQLYAVLQSAYAGLANRRQ